MKLKKRLGQNFLTDKNIIRKEVKLADVEGKDVVEIGAGDGRLTVEIVAANPKVIYAIEKDKEFADALKRRFAGEKRVVVIEGDFLELELPRFDVALGNIPYYISSGIIFRLAKCKFEHAILIVQKEFADKMMAKPNEKNYGRLSVTSQIAFDVSLVQTVPRYLFYPQPKVDSALIVLKPTGRSLNEFEEDVIRALFQHRNKTVANALLHSKKFTEDSIALLKDYCKRRVRTLSKEECLEIAATLKTR